MTPFALYFSHIIFMMGSIMASSLSRANVFFPVLLKLNFVKLLRKSNIGKEADNVPQACSPLNKITFDHTLFPDPIILFESKGNYSLTSDPQRDQCLI